MPDVFDRAPKVELHLHLEGAVPLDTLWDLVQKYGGDSAVPTRQSLVEHLQYTSFANFIDTWWWMTGFVRSYDDFEAIATGVAADLAKQHIVYAEASFSPTDFERHGLSPQGIAQAIRTGLAKVPEAQVVLNCDLVRDTGPERATRTLAAVLDVAEETDIRGITIGGSEQAYPPDLFVEVYQQAAAAGMHRTAHAGEAAGPRSVRAALDLLGVERIGHGISTVGDARLLARVVTDQVPLEVCPTSNIRTGVVPDWDNHPVGALLAAGANVTISSDDPTFFHSSVADDLRSVSNLYNADAQLLTERAISASWLTNAEKAAVKNLVSAWWANTTSPKAAAQPTAESR